MHLIVYSSVLSFTDKKINLWSVSLLFITYHMKISNLKLKLHVLDAVFRTKKTIILRFSLQWPYNPNPNLNLFSAKIKKYFKSPYNT